MNKIITTILLAIATAVNVCGQTDTARAVATEDTVFYNHTLRNVTVKARQSDRSRRLVANTEIIGTGELIRAACCNLGETFTTYFPVPSPLTFPFPKGNATCRTLLVCE